MGYSVPRPDEENKYRTDRPPAGGLTIGQPAGSPPPQDDFSGLEQVGSLSEFEDLIQPYKEEEAQPGEVPVQDTDYTLFDAPVLNPANAGGQELGGGGLRMVPTASTDNEGPGGHPDPDGGADKGSSKGLGDPSLGFGIDAHVDSDPGAGDGGGDDRVRGVGRSRRATTPDQARQTAEHLRSQGVTAEEASKMSTQGTYGQEIVAALEALEKEEEEKTIHDAMNIEEALANDNVEWSELDGTNIPGLGEGFRVAINKATGEVWIKPTDGDWEVWDGSDALAMDDLLNEDGTPKGDWAVEPIETDIQTDDMGIRTILALAGNPTEKDLRDWADRRNNDSEEIQPDDPRWWYGLLAKALGYSDVYHRPYTSPPEEFEELMSKYPELFEYIT